MYLIVIYLYRLKKNRLKKNPGPKNLYQYTV